MESLDDVSPASYGTAEVSSSSHDGSSQLSPDVGPDEVDAEEPEVDDVSLDVVVAADEVVSAIVAARAAVAPALTTATTARLRRNRRADPRLRSSARRRRARAPGRGPGTTGPGTTGPGSSMRALDHTGMRGT